MRIWIVDAFARQIFAGNQAGVVLLEEQEDFPSREFMQGLAAELKHSETAYVKRTGPAAFALKYFTPAGEVDLCGHATISAFTVLRELTLIPCGTYQAKTKAGSLSIQVSKDIIWMDMATPWHIRDFSPEECRELYEAYGLHLSAMPEALAPAVVNTGLGDILLPVKSRDLLNQARMDRGKVCSLSKKYQVVGMHLFCADKKKEESEKRKVDAFCRNFAPLYGIEEEAATGTSSGALTYYLKNHNLVEDNTVNTFLQGEAMKKPSLIYTKIRDGKIQVGGTARICLECRLFE